MTQWFTLLSTDPTLLTYQWMLVGIAAVAVFLVFFTARDITLRSRSFFMQLFCIALVALLPVLGFFLYLLLRPPRTIKDRDTERLLEKLIALQAENLSIISFEQKQAPQVTATPEPVAIPLSNLPSSAFTPSVSAVESTPEPEEVPTVKSEKARPKKSSRHLHKAKSRH